MELQSGKFESANCSEGSEVRVMNPIQTRSKRKCVAAESGSGQGGQIESHDSSARNCEVTLDDYAKSNPNDQGREETPCPKKKKRWSSARRAKQEKPIKLAVERISRSSDYQAEKKRLWRLRQPYLKCPDCDYRTKDKDTYGSHIAKHNPAVERFFCEECDKTFRNKRSFRCHLRSHGSPEQLHQCTHCDFRTPSRINWLQHLAVKHKVDASGNVLTAAFACTECSYTCMAEYQLKAHFSRKHLPDKAYKCQQCSYSSHIRFEVEKHMKIKHLNIRNYICDRCGKTSQTKSGLERHKQTHTPGLKPFKCTKCDAAYADNRKLKSHLVRHENNEKPYRCPLCTHSCHRRDNLQMHVKRIHKTTFSCVSQTASESAARNSTSSLPESTSKVIDRSSLQYESLVVDAGSKPLSEEKKPLENNSYADHKLIRFDVECQVIMEVKEV